MDERHEPDFNDLIRAKPELARERAKRLTARLAQAPEGELTTSDDHQEKDT